MSTYLSLQDTVPVPRSDLLSYVRSGLLYGSLILLGALMTVGWFHLRETISAPPSLVQIKTSHNEGTAQLAAGGITVERRHGFVTVCGEVRNISPCTLEKVEAVVEFMDRAGRLQSVETALLELPTVRPGEESPFSVHALDKPSLASYRIRFRRLLGPTIPSR